MRMWKVGVFTLLILLMVSLCALPVMACDACLKAPGVGASVHAMEIPG